MLFKWERKQENKLGYRWEKDKLDENKIDTYDEMLQMKTQ